MKNRISVPKITLLIVLLIVSMSCNLLSTLNPDPTPEAAVPQIIIPAVPLTDQAFTVSITESQMNEYAASAVSANPNLPIQEPVITLPEGLIEINGRVQQGPLKADIRLLAQPYATPDGNLKVELIQADLGSVPASGPILDAIASSLEELLTVSLASMTNNYWLNSVVITGGVLTFSGQPR